MYTILDATMNVLYIYDGGKNDKAREYPMYLSLSLCLYTIRNNIIAADQT